MKICYLADINNYHTQKWCNYFLSQGHEVLVISLTDGHIAGCRAFCFGFSNVKGLSSVSKVKYLLTISKIKKILQKEKPDILHSHYASSYGLIGSLTNYKPHIISLWGSDVYSFPNKSLIHRKTLELSLNSNSEIFSTSKCMKVEAEKYLKTNKNIVITPFGVDLSVFHPTKRKGHSRFIIGINKSLEPVSGIDILIKSMDIISRNLDINNFELRISGKGGKDAELKKLVKDLNLTDHVKFYGFLSQGEMANFLNDLDIAVYPSLAESFGVAAVEAQACGTPVITSDVDGFKESTEPGVTSLLFKQGNAKELAEKIIHLYLNRGKIDKMREKGIELAAEKFNININFREVEKEYEKILNY
ncbi:glycosyltransferase involved in cell wall biosynthesis [Rossellomorea marisflavi]